MFGQLIKITAAKKLMIKINDIDYQQTLTHLSNEYKKHEFAIKHLAVFKLKKQKSPKDFSTKEDADFGADELEGSEQGFILVSLDKYDRQNMRKFESLIKKNIRFQFRMKSYDVPSEQKDTPNNSGVNLELINVWLAKDQANATRFIEQKSLPPALSPSPPREMISQSDERHEFPEEKNMTPEDLQMIAFIKKHIDSENCDEDEEKDKVAPLRRSRGFSLGSASDSE